MATAPAMRVIALILALLALSPGASAQDPVGNPPPTTPRQSLDALRRGIPLNQEGRPLPMRNTENADLRRKRAYPEQPPTIPHSIDSYQIDKNSNRCLLCHARAGAFTFQAPMISVTHFVDRDGQVLATVSPRRYFCTQCHVPQTDAKPLVENDFRDIDEIVSAEARKKD
jgi:cytochrome c-type protein NapB